MQHFEMFECSLYMRILRKMLASNIPAFSRMPRAAVAVT